MTLDWHASENFFPFLVSSLDRHLYERKSPPPFFFFVSPLDRHASENHCRCLFFFVSPLDQHASENHCPLYFFFASPLDRHASENHCPLYFFFWGWPTEWHVTRCKKILALFFPAGSLAAQPAPVQKSMAMCFFRDPISYRSRSSGNAKKKYIFAVIS